MVDWSVDAGSICWERSSRFCTSLFCAVEMGGDRNVGRPDGPEAGCLAKGLRTSWG